MSDLRQGRYDIVYDPDRDLVRVEFSGRMTAALMKGGQDALHEVPGVMPRTLLLIVCTKAELDEIDINILTEHQVFKLAMGYPTQRAAVVVDDKPGHRAIAELWAATRHGGKAGGAAVFIDEAAAAEWLLAGR